ncbi:hypothetical protein KR018_001638, partial [Drosophila ironensis]
SSVTLLTVVVLTTVSMGLVSAADPECVYRKIRGLSAHWPNPTSCSSYYRCSSKNTVRMMNCPSGKEYNPKTGKCGNAGRGLCTLSLVAPLADTTNACADEVNGAYLADSENCGQFYICDEQKAYLQQCQSGSYFDSVIGVCVPDTETTCWANFCIGKADGSAVADKSNCTIFYVCSSNTATLQECPEGSYFEQDGWACVPGTCTTEPPCDDTTTTTEACDESTTTELPGCDCENAKNGELVYDPDNCRQFYICINGELVTGDCGTGNRFDSILKVCVVDENNECCTESCSNGAVKVNPQDCSKYTVCENGQWLSKSCASGSYFNKYACEVDSEKVCIDGTTSTTTTTTETTESTVTTSLPTDTSSTAIPASALDASTLETAAECNARDPPTSGKNCWSYSVCISGRWQQEVCAKNFYFDASTGICRKDTDNLCPENKSTKVKSKKRRPKRDAGPEEPSSDCTCEGGLEQGAIVAHPTDCDKYLICNNGELVEGFCGVGNVFKNCSGVCAPDTGATCWLCSNKPNGYKMPNPSSCTGYLTCWNGVATEHYCGSNEWYDLYSEVCAVDVNANCLNPCTCSTGNVAHPICTQYFQCTDGVAQVETCPSGEAFDSSTDQCSSTVECSAKSCATAEDGTTYPVTDDSSKFYLCLNKVATIVACPPNTAYSTTLGICQSQPSCDCDQSVCNDDNEDDTYPSQNNDTSSFCICQNGGGYLNSCPSGLFYDEQEKICTFEGNCDPRECNGQDDYYVFPDDVDPNSFCLCRAGEPTAVTCPIGYTFNSEELSCVLIPLPDPRCNATACLGQANFTSVPALNTYDGFCICIDEMPQYNSCAENSQYNNTLGVCVPSESTTQCESNACDASTCDDSPDYSYFPVENNPTAFCYCSNSCPVFNTCPDDKEFNVNLLICTTVQDPTESQCNEEMCDSLDEYVPFPANNGTSGFCYCENGMPYYNSCNEGQQFNASLLVCITPVPDVSCSCDGDQCDTLDNYDPFPTKTDDDNSFCYCFNGDVFLGQCDADMVYNATQKSCTVLAASECVCAPGKCNSEDFTVYAAENTTTGFCMCLDSVPVYKACNEGQTFNTEYSTCMNATAAISGTSGCDSSLCLTRASFTSAFAATNTTAGYCVCQEVGQAAFFQCDAGHMFDFSKGLCTITSMIQCNLQECSKRARFEAFASASSRLGFCSCDDEDRISVTFHPCSVGQLFSPELGVCTSSHGIQKRSLEAEENECDRDEKRSVPANCSQYEVCIDGHWRRRTCSDQRYYNPEQQRCLEPRDDLVCAYARVANLPPCDEWSESRTVAAKNGSCQQYFRCSGGKWRLRNCPKQHYFAPLVGTCLPLPQERNQEQSVCDWIMDRNSGNSSEDCQQLSVRPSKAGGCHSYLMCLDNAWWLHQCPLGMYFSREHNYCLPNDKGQCLMPENRATSGCPAGDSRALVGSCDSYEVCQNNQWIRKRCQEREQFEPLLGCIPSDGSCQASGMRRICREGHLRALAEADNCSQGFLFCEAEEWHLGSCLRDHGYVGSSKKCLVQSQCHLLRALSTENQCLGLSDGWSVPDPTDCTRFYLCLQQEPAVLQSCPSGSFFDAEQAYCRPNDGSCQLAVCSGVEEGKLVAHPDDCRAYYSCSSQNGTALLRCDEGQYFHSLLSICRVDNGQCMKQANEDNSVNTTRICSGLHGVRLPHELYCNLYYACVKGLAIPVECPQRQQFNPVLSACEPESQAVESCRNGQLESNSSSHVYSCGSLPDGSFLANRTDCTYYFICAGGVAMAQRCAAGHYFDSVQLLCLVDDGSCPMVEPVGDDEETNNQHVPPDPLVCEGKHGYAMPDPANCNNFYLCISGTLRHELCYTDYFFNATLQQCQVYEANSGADEQPEQPAESQRENTSTGICKDKPTSFDAICPVIGNNSVAEQGDCRRYTSCEDEVATSQRCRNGESFDSLLGICRQSDGTCLMENGERVGVCTGKHGQLVRDADNCRGYFMCVHGQKIEGDCGLGNFFNRLTSSCELDTQQQCQSEGTEI